MQGESLMRRVTAAFEEGDIKPLMEALHPEVVWKSASKLPGTFPFGGSYKDRIGVVEVLARIATRYTFVRFKPRHIVEQGNCVWGLFDAKIAYRQPKAKAAKSVSLEMAILWKLRGGKIVEHQAFFDTASLLVQQGAVISQP